MQKFVNFDCSIVVTNMAETLAYQMGVQHSIGPSLLKLLDGGVDSLSCSCKHACCQHFYLLGMADLGVGVDYFLSCFQ